MWNILQKYNLKENDNRSLKYLYKYNFRKDIDNMRKFRNNKYIIMNWLEN